MKKITTFLFSLILYISAMGQTSDPVITMTTETYPITDFTFYLKATNNNTSIQVDFGDGKPVSKIIGTSKTAISGTLVGSNKLTHTIKIYGNGITYLNCSENKISSLDVSKNSTLQELHCYDNQLLKLNVTQNKELTILDCSINQIEELIVEENEKLTMLYCYENPLKGLSVTKNKLLTKLYCASNQLTKLDLTENEKLIELSCSSNQLTELGSVANLTSLTKFDCSDNQLTALDVSKNTLLTILRCNSNKIKALYIAKTTLLTELNCNNNQLTELDLATNTLLTGLYCGINQLSKLTLTTNEKLKELNCGQNSLTELVLTKNTNLIRVNCDYNQLKELDVKQNNGLIFLFCNSNQLEKLIVGNLPKLQTLYCDTNQLTFATLPVKQPEQTAWKYYRYAAQRPIPISKDINTGIEIDLSIYSRSGDNTAYTWKTKSGSVLKKGTDYIITDGKTTFITPQNESIYCEMTNTSFPDFKEEKVLKTTNVNIVAGSQQSQTITFGPLTPKKANDLPFDLTAIASSGLDVIFESSDNKIASIEGKIVTILKAGTVKITAIQAGNSLFAPTTASQTLEITKEIQTITFNTLPNKITGDAQFELMATASSSLPVTYTSSDPSVASISGSIVTILKAGTVVITAAQAGDNSWEAVTATQSLTITDPTGIEEIEEEYVIGPNPVSNTLYIKTPNSGNGKFSIVSLTGSKIVSGIIKDESIDVSGLSAGVYLLQLEYSGKTIRTVRFVKH